jgi:hypothetical protein
MTKWRISVDNTKRATSLVLELKIRELRGPVLIRPMGSRDYGVGR